MLQLLSVDDIVDSSLDTLDDNGSSILHLLELLLRQDSVRLRQFLEIFSGLVSLEHVFERGETEMVIDVVESCRRRIDQRRFESIENAKTRKCEIRTHHVERRIQ